MSLWDDFVNNQKSKNPQNTVPNANTPKLNSAGGNLLNLIGSGKVGDQTSTMTTPSMGATIVEQNQGLANTYDVSNKQKDIQVPEYKQVTTLLDEHVYRPVYEAASAVALAQNPDTYKDAGLVEGLKKAWNGRKDISLGQAVGDLAANYANKSLPDWGPLAELNKVDINIYDQKMRERVYSRMYNEAGQRVDSAGNIIADSSWVENAWRGMSGTVDFTKQMVLDPLVFVGKVAKLSRLKFLDNMRYESIVKTPEWATHQAEHAAADIAARDSRQKLINLAPEFERVDGVMKRINAGELDEATIKSEVNYVRDINGQKPINENKPVEEFVQAYQDHYASLDKEVMDHIKTIEAVNNPNVAKPKLATGVQEFVQQVVNRQMTWQEIAQHRTIRDFAVDTEFLSKALADAGKRGEGAVADVLLLAQGADPGVVLRLQGQHSSLLNMIDTAQTKMDDLEIEIQRALNEFKPETRARLQLQKNQLSDYVKDLQKENEYISYLLNTENSLVGTLPGMPFSNAGRLSPYIENARANRAIVKAGLQDGSIKPVAKRLKTKGAPQSEFNWERVQGSPLHKPVYFAQWVGHRLGLEKPSGFVTVDGLDYYDGVRELRTYLDNTPVFDGLVSEKNAFLDEYVSATNSIARKQIIDKVEKDVFNRLADKYNLNVVVKKEVDGKVKEVNLAEEAYQIFIKKRAQAVEQFKRDRVFAVDSNQTLVANPVLASQLDYSVPMLDTDALDKFFATAAEDPNWAQKIMRSSRTIKDEVIWPAWSMVDRLWRADVLIRLGYTQRNVLSEILTMSVHDAGLHNMFSVGKVSKATANFMSNRYAHFQDVADRYSAALEVHNTPGGKIAMSVRALTPMSFKWVEYEKYATDLIAMKIAERDGIIAHANDLIDYWDSVGGKFEFPTATIEKLNADIAREEAKLQTVADRVRARGDRFGKKNSIANESVRIGPYEFAGVAEGPQGKAAQALISSGGRMNFEASPMRSALKEMGLDNVGGYTDIHPTDDTYFYQLADVINKQFGNSKVAMMVIEGKPEKEIIAYLESPAGQAELRNLNWKQELLDKKQGGRKKAGKSTGEKFVVAEEEDQLLESLFRNSIADQGAEQNYLDYVKYQIIDRYLPNDKMKQLVKDQLSTDELGRGKGMVTSADLRIASRDTQLNPIHGQIFDKKSIWGNDALSNTKKLDLYMSQKLIKPIMRIIGEIPEDAMISTPFARATYDAKLEEIVKTWMANDVSPTATDILQAQTVARKWAVKQSREYLYRVVRKNSIGDSIPLLSPFFQAQYSTMRRAGKLSYRNPDKAARVVYLWNQINTNAIEDQNGNRWLMFRVPPSWYDDKGVSSLMPESLRNAINSMDNPRWNVNSFNMLLAGLRIEAPDVLPGQEENTVDKVARWAKSAQSILGTGPLVQIAANEIIKNNPALDEEATKILGVTVPRRDILEIFASPFPSDNWYAPLQSAWNRRVATLMTGNVTGERVDNKKMNGDFERTQIVMFQNHLDRIRTGEEDPKSEEELWKMAAEEASAFTAVRLLANLSLGFIPTYEGKMSGYVELYRTYQQKYGTEAYNKWLEHYPDMGYIAISRSKNLAGSSASTSAVGLREKYNTQIEKAIKATALPREDALSFVQMVTNGEPGAAVLRDPYATYWQKKKGDRINLTAEEGYDSEKIREGWAEFFKMNEEYQAKLKEYGLSPYSAGAAAFNEKKRQFIQEIGKTNKQWWGAYSTTNNADTAVGFVRAMKVMLNDEKFMSEQPKDSFWYDIQGILEVRDEMINYAHSNGYANPTTDMQDKYWLYIQPYLANPTANYYYQKFLDNDGFKTDTPE